MTLPKYLPFTPLAHCQGRVTGQERCCRGIGDRLWDYEASHTTDGDIQQKMGGNLHSFWLLMLSCCSSFGSFWSLGTIIFPASPLTGDGQFCSLGSFIKVIY